MQFPPSNPVRALPLCQRTLQHSFASQWRRVTDTYEAWGADVLVNVHSSKLVVALPEMEYVRHGGQRHLPPNGIVFLLGRLGWVEDSRLAIDLASSGLSAATFASFEAWAVADGRLDWSPTSETGFLQRVLTLAVELAAGELPAELKMTADSFVPFVGHDDSAGGPDWTDSWQSRMTVASLTKHRMPGPYADAILLLGRVRRRRQ